MCQLCIWPKVHWYAVAITLTPTPTCHPHSKPTPHSCLLGRDSSQMTGTVHSPPLHTPAQANCHSSLHLPIHRVWHYISTVLCCSQHCTTMSRQVGNCMRGWRECVVGRPTTLCFSMFECLTAHMLFFSCGSLDVAPITYVTCCFFAE